MPVSMNCYNNGDFCWKITATLQVLVRVESWEARGGTYVYNVVEQDGIFHRDVDQGDLKRADIERISAWSRLVNGTFLHNDVSKEQPRLRVIRDRSKLQAGDLVYVRGETFDGVSLGRWLSIEEVKPPRLVLDGGHRLARGASSLWVAARFIDGMEVPVPGATPLPPVRPARGASGPISTAWDADDVTFAEDKEPAAPVGKGSPVPLTDLRARFRSKPR